MGILDLFFGPPDPALEWTRSPELRFECELSEPSLAGVRLGDPVARLAKFGAPQNRRPTSEGAYDYRSQGFEIDATGGAVDCFLFLWDASDPARRFAGEFTMHGKPVALGAETPEADFLARFGEPYWVDDDGFERLLFYERGPVEWQAEFRRGKLVVLTLLTPPLLADEAERKAYGVTKPWPPA